MSGVLDVWRVVFNERFCVAAATRSHDGQGTCLYVWDFGEDVEGANAEVEDEWESDEEGS